jgi:hypothetical protein
LKNYRLSEGASTANTHSVAFGFLEMGDGQLNQAQTTKNNQKLLSDEK